MDNNCEGPNCPRQTFDAPNANSTMISDLESGSDILRHVSSNIKSVPTHNVTVHSEFGRDSEDFSIGHISHIPRRPPTPTTYTIPSYLSKHAESNDLFGMIKLKDNDVCYTSGSIEWVGRKRCYPINSGFKVINESFRQGNELLLKKKRLDKTFTVGADDKIKECDCADVLPTMNAIVDHLNALHEAVDLVDLRLNNLEDVTNKNNN